MTETALERLQRKTNAASSIEEVNQALREYDEASKAEAAEEAKEPDPIADAKSSRDVVAHMEALQKEITGEIDRLWKEEGRFQVPVGEVSEAISKAETVQEVIRLAAEAGISQDPVGVSESPEAPEIDLEELAEAIAAAKTPGEMEAVMAARGLGIYE